MQDLLLLLLLLLFGSSDQLVGQCVEGSPDSGLHGVLLQQQGNKQLLGEGLHCDANSVVHLAVEVLEIEASCHRYRIIEHRISNVVQHLIAHDQHVPQR